MAKESDVCDYCARFKVLCDSLRKELEKVNVKLKVRIRTIQKQEERIQELGVRIYYAEHKAGRE